MTRGPYLQRGSSDSIVVRWRTNVPTTSRVIYGEQPGSLAFAVSDATLTTEHEIALDGLVPESQYFLTLLDGTSQSYIHVGDKNGSRLPDYGRVDVSASMNLTDFGLPGWEVGASVLNLFDRRNVRYRSYDLDVTPIVVSDVLDLGFTPTLFLKAAF